MLFNVPSIASILEVSINALAFVMGITLLMLIVADWWFRLQSQSQNPSHACCSLSENCDSAEQSRNA